MSSSTHADGGGGAGPSSVEPPPPVEQLMENIEEKAAVTLDQRLHAMDEVDRRVDDLLTVVAEVLASLDKDKPLSKAKMEELYKKYELRLDEIQRGIAEQLTYMEQVCVGAEHQGSTFHLQQVVELSVSRVQSLHAQLATLLDIDSNGSREEVGAGQRTNKHNEADGGGDGTEPQCMEQ